MAIYRPRLSNLMNLCEVNYMMLLRLLADKEQVGEIRCFFISDFLSYSIRVNEVTRYTSLITMKQDASIGNQHLSDYFSPKMVIRLYHDARLAEVVSNQDVWAIKPRYDYPNQAMHLPDEKQQINEFLKEWLQLSLQLGQSKVEFA
ncbi:phosphohydrolase [Thalassotalea insulae]|uniref:Phosphohydrolase n=2 Tax=Thalassotalea insulae TaxID=2056778 RepID=A0ABQ6GV63_9GAMM|nr:phosphohydrolase [Thalassotalea insulae]